MKQAGHQKMIPQLYFVYLFPVQLKQAPPPQAQFSQAGLLTIQFFKQGIHISPIRAIRVMGRSRPFAPGAGRE